MVHIRSLILLFYIILYHFCFYTMFAAKLIYLSYMYIYSYSHTCIHWFIHMYIHKFMHVQIHATSLYLDVEKGVFSVCGMHDIACCFLFILLRLVLSLACVVQGLSTVDSESTFHNGDIYTLHSPTQLGIQPSSKTGHTECLVCHSPMQRAYLELNLSCVKLKSLSPATSCLTCLPGH